MDVIYAIDALDDQHVKELSKKAIELYLKCFEEYK